MDQDNMQESLPGMEVLTTQEAFLPENEPTIAENAEASGKPYSSGDANNINYPYAD
jgi:hypothetical protein